MKAPTSQHWFPGNGVTRGLSLLEFSTLFREVFLRVLRFSPLVKNQPTILDNPVGESTHLSALIPRKWRHTWVEFVGVLYSVPRGFSPGTPVFPSRQKPTYNFRQSSGWKHPPLSIDSQEMASHVGWVCWSSLLCSERFFSGYSGFPLSSKTNLQF